MASASALRLQRDWKELATAPPSGVSASPASEGDLYSWTATICGPEETPFEGGLFRLSLQFGESYPARPPRVRFLTDVFHPNVYPDGNICLDTLQDRWSPCLTVSSLLVMLLSLLTDPNPASPANPAAASMYVNDRAAYNKRVRRCAARSLEEC